MTKSAVWGFVAAVGTVAVPACASPRASVEPGVGSGPEPAAEVGTGEDASTDVQFDVPPDYLPPPGQCRIWEPGEPPGPQREKYPVGRCSELRESIPDGAWLMYRPADGSGFVRVWQYGSEREVLFQRIYDIETGDLVRHVAPASGE